MFLPTTLKEVKALHWDALDVILVTGDAYIDSPFIGVAVIGKVLVDKGFRVGIIAQPDTESDSDILRLGEPRLFWGVTGGCIDSMVANYTPLKKRRKQDDYTPGGINSKRPDRAVIAYANLIRRFFKNTCPIVLGGIEASLRRIAHYDFWSNKIRRSILFDARADYLLFGMAHDTVVQFAKAIRDNGDPSIIDGVAWISKDKKGMELPSFEAVQKENSQYIKSFQLFYDNTDPMTAGPLCQQHGDRYLVLNVPAPYSSTAELDHIHELPYERDLHPFYRQQGEVRALDTIRFSIPTHYGCYGECRFCAIAVHQGRTVRYRSEASVVREAESLSKLKNFKGYITDLGGPTANMYGFECRKKRSKGICHDKQCLYPTVCKSLLPDHSPHMRLIRKIEQIPGIKKVFISSGIRYDLILADKKHGMAYLEKLVNDNVSGQMKIAPEHSVPRVLKQMGKQDIGLLLKFKKEFYRLSERSGKKQFLTYYFIAAHPGCTMADMLALKRFTMETLKTRPEQVQIFTPTPSTWSTLMYYTGIDPATQEAIFVERNPQKKDQQKQAITGPPEGKNKRKKKYRR